jgi:F-type H+-transporting ATPase subunit epsilon
MSERRLHLVIATPATVVRDLDDVVSVRAEDASGGFGILPGHADFLTVLDASVIGWTRAGGHAEYGVVSGGVLRVEGGRRISLAARSVVTGSDPERLKAEIVAAREALDDADRKARTADVGMQTRAVRQMVRYLRDRPEEVTP